MKRVHVPFNAEKVKTVVIVFEGTGNPRDDHEIVGVAFFDEFDTFISGVGQIKEDIFKEEITIEPFEEEVDLANTE